MSAYLLFCNAPREDFQAANPGLNFGQVTAELAAKWQAASDQ